LIAKKSIIKDIDALVLLLALITPAMPKIKIAEGIYIYIIEVFLIILLPYYLRKIRLKVQIYLFIFWISIFCSTLLSYLSVIEVGGILRVIKGIIYLPLCYIAFQKFELQDFRLFLKIFIVASIFNILLLIYNIKLYGLNFWDVRTISSGLSNRFISLSDIEIGTIESGAHGIWGNYCILSFAINIYLKIKQKINTFLFIIVNIAVLLGFGLSVSREAMITLLFVCLGIIYMSGSLRRMIINKIILKWFAFLLAFAVIIIIFFGDNIPIIQKILYTIDSIKSSGSESNIQLRINGWIVFIESLYRNPEKIITGYGFNHQYYESHLSFAAYKSNSFVALPESFFIMAMCYGGIIAFIFSIYFFKEIFIISLKIHDKILKVLLTFFFCGILFGNIFSGASIIADMLYSQILILLGFLIAQNNDKSIANYNSK
jgi:hypothetical protein